MKDLKAFLDGELDAASAATMQGRLQSDAELARAAGSFRLISDSFGALTLGPPVTGRERVVQALSAPRKSVFPWNWAMAATSILLVFMMVRNFAVNEAAAGVETAVGQSVTSPGTLQDSEDLTVLPPATAAPGRAGAAKAEAEAQAQLRVGAGADSGLESKNATVEGQVFERKVIRTARLTVRVKSIESAEDAVTAWVEQARGYVDNTTSNNLNGKNPSMTLTVRVPQAKFSQALAAFEKLGVRTSKNIESSDVTQQIVDMDARLKNLRSQEETYRAILRTTRRVGEIIDVQERLSMIRGEIESMQAQRDSTAKLAALSTISVTLDQRPPAEDAQSIGWVEDTWSSATGALGEAFKSLSVIGIWILVYSPIWIPLSLVTVWGWRRALRA
jgi:hypothetical protein